MQYICYTMSCTGWTFLSGCSSVSTISCVQRSIDVWGTQYRSTWRTAASTPQTLLVASICGPPAAISCSYRDTGVRCSMAFSVAGPAAWNSLPDYLWDPSRSFEFLLWPGNFFSFCCQRDSALLTQRRIYVTVRCPSVCLSVCPIYRPLQQRAAGLLLWARRTGDIDRQRRPPSSTAASSKCGQCHVVSWRRKLNTDLSRLCDYALHEPTVDTDIYVETPLVRTACRSRVSKCVDLRSRQSRQTIRLVYTGWVRKISCWF